MAVKIIEIAPKPNTTVVSGDKVLAHLSIKDFKWVNEQTLQSGVSSLEIMFDWIVNKKGVAFIKVGEETIFVYGAYSPSGKKPYLRCLKNGNWTNELLDLPAISS